MVIMDQGLSNMERKRNITALRAKDRPGREDVQQRQEMRRRRTDPKTASKTRTRQPRLPRPRQPLTFELPKHMITSEPSTQTAKGSSIVGQAQSRNSTPGLGSEPPLVRLSRIDILFSAIHRRNKNQHRNQPFYKHLSFLRRSVKKLIGLHEQSAALAGTASSATTQKTVIVSSAAEIRQRFERESKLRSQREVLEEHIRETLVPAAYVAFSGVVADTQFANLGVVLLGILADIVGVVGSMKKIERVKRQEKDGHNVERAGIGGRLVALSTLMTGPDHGAVVERVYDSDGGLEVNESGSKTGKEHKIQVEDSGLDMGVVVQRNEKELGGGTPDVSKVRQVKSRAEEDNSEEQELETDKIYKQTMSDSSEEEEKVSTMETTSTRVKTETSQRSPLSSRDAKVSSSSERKTKKDSDTTSKSKNATNNAGDKRTTLKSIDDESRTNSNSTAKASKTSVPSPSLRAETMQREVDEEKARKATKKKKRANAIDDLFSGFG